LKYWHKADHQVEVRTVMEAVAEIAQERTCGTGIASLEVEVIHIHQAKQAIHEVAN
jgi:hypothetical protein